MPSSNDVQRRIRSGGKDPSTARQRIQKTYRFPVQLEREFGQYLEETGENANAVLQALVADLLERWYGSNLEPGQLDYLRRFWTHIPAALAIKEIRGRVMFGNPEFRRVIGCSEVTGALPTDYFRDDLAAARRVMAHDHAAVENQKPILSVDIIPVGGDRRRLAVRFPIFDRAHQRVEMTGVIGFDLELVEKLASSLRPGDSSRFGDEVLPFPEETALPDSMLRAFIYNLPAILTVKDLDSTLLCVNAEYTRVTGRQRSDVVGKRPSENWQGELGRLIETRDREVLERRVPVMSVETIPCGKGSRDRMNIRFPIMGPRERHTVVEFIGTIGLDYGVVRRGVELLRDADQSKRANSYLLTGNADSSEILPILI